MSITAVDGHEPSRRADVPHSDPRRWITVYAIYLDKNKTLEQGRRVPRAIGVNRPSLQDIVEAINSTVQLQTVVEQSKMYSRNPYDNVGRVKIQIKNADGEPVKGFISSKSQLLYALCDAINDSTTRQSRVDAEELAEKKFKEKYASVTVGAQQSITSGKQKQKKLKAKKK